MKLAWAERKHADFERMIQEERGARADVQARLEELEADDAKRAISVSNGEALKIAIEQKHTELEAARRDMTTAIKETDDTRRQLLISLATNNRLGEEVKLLKGQLSAADTRSQDIARSQALINNQQTEIDARKTQIGDLLSQNHQHVQDAQSQKQELENVREALALAEASRDW
jgi:chromosome segregation ATPase